MYDIKLRYLASVYLDADSIIPNARIISELQQKINDGRFMPTTAFEQQQDKRIHRIGFHIPNEGFLLVLATKRFDYSWTPFDREDMGKESLEHFCLEAKAKLTSTLDFFQRKCRRIALVQEGLLSQMDDLKLQESAKKLLKLSATFANNLPFEWDWRAASSIKRTFGGIEEPTNTIVTIKRGSGTLNFQSGKQIAFDRIRVDLDINTSPDDSRERFGLHEVNSFFDAAIGWQIELSEEVKEFLSIG